MWCVLTIDQIDSRTGPDRVASLVEELSGVTGNVQFERTAGDELQGLITDGEALADALEHLLRSGGWHIGVGFGAVELPLPDSVRAGRGSAFLNARAAVTSAKSSPWHLRVEGPAGEHLPRQMETVAWLWAALLDRRSAKGWQVADLVASGMNYQEAAAALGVSRPAISQRAASAGIVEGRRAKELIAQLGATILQAGGNR